MTEVLCMPTVGFGHSISKHKKKKLCSFLLFFMFIKRCCWTHFSMRVCERHFDVHTAIKMNSFMDHIRYYVIISCWTVYFRKKRNQFQRKESMPPTIKSANNALRHIQRTYIKQALCKHRFGTYMYVCQVLHYNFEMSCWMLFTKLVHNFVTSFVCYVAVNISSICSIFHHIFIESIQAQNS